MIADRYILCKILGLSQDLDAILNDMYERDTAASAAHRKLLVGKSFVGR